MGTLAGNQASVNKSFANVDDFTSNGNGAGIGPNGQAALTYADAEYSVVPLCWPDAHSNCGCFKHHTIPRDIGKAPLLAAGYEQRKLTRAEVIGWWLRCPLANIGILLEPAGYLVVDSDSPEADREVEQRGVPPGPRVKSPHGIHRYFSANGNAGRTTKQGESHAIDVLSLGYIVVPPSRTPAGVYTWEFHLDDMELEDAPAWAVKMLSEQQEKPPPITIKGDLVPVELTGLGLDGWLIEVITKGQPSHPDKYPSRSEALFAAETGLLRAGCSIEVIVSILLDPRYKISEKPREQGRKWLLEDIARNQAKQETEREGMNGSAPPETEWTTFESDARGPEESSERPFIKITTDITTVVDAAEKAILALPDGPHLFQHTRRLCGIARGVPKPRGLERAPDAPIIAQVELPALRELVNKAAQWGKYDKRTKKYEPALPPEWVIATLTTRLSWKFPILESIVCAPTLRADGTIIDTPGYDPSTGLYLDTNGVRFPPIPAHATIDDAVAALAILDEIFLDFPFAALHFQSAALAAVLTVSARHAILGCTPLFAVRSNTPASGKGLMVDTITTVSAGHGAAHWPQVQDEDEDRKRLLTIALSGDPCVHIDNVSQPLGSAPLDSAITARTVSDRLLGKNKHATVPFSAVLFASGNNMTFTGDMSRRVIPIDLDPKREKPEERTDFQHAPLLPWVQKNRPQFLVAALTVLKAYFNAGRPSQGVSALGSFEEWSDLIRQALIWAGKPDPGEGRKNIEAESDTGYESLASLLHCWAECYLIDAVTLAHAIGDIGVRAEAEPSLVSPANKWNALFESLGKFDSRFDGKRLDSKRVGDGIRKIQGRVLDGQRFVKDGKTDGVNRWRVETMET